jgi:hypothetical protein
MSCLFCSARRSSILPFVMAEFYPVEFKFDL